MIRKYIDMQNENSLIALAYIKESDNPLQVFCNYAIICFMKSATHSLRYDELAKEIEMISGLKMSSYMIKMCCSILKKENKISKLPNGAGYKLLDTTFSIVDYETQKSLLQNKEFSVINDLILFVKKYNLDWDYDYARNHLTDFLLLQGNATSIFTNNYVKTTKNEKYIPPSWYVGKYVTNLINIPNDLTEYLIDIINGLMIYIGVYEAQDYKQNYAQKFKGTMFFLDTKIILRLMEYSWKLETDSAKELVELIQEYGGVICVFEHTIEEIKFALSSAADCLDKKDVILDFELRIGVELKNFDSYDLRLDKNSIREIIEKELKFKIYPDIDWTDEKVHKYNLDRTTIKNYIIGRHPNWKLKAIDNDVDIINYINILRKGNYEYKYGGKKKLPIFITSNSSLVYDVKSYIEEFGSTDKNIANWNPHALPIITDNMLMCRLWVPKSSNLTFIPKLTLARNAYAAQQVDLSFFEKLKDTAQQLQKNHNIDLINVSAITKEKIEEIVIKNISGDIDDLSEEILASSADELVRLETLNVQKDNQQLAEDNSNKAQIIEQKNKNIVISAAQRYKNKLGIKKILIYLSEFYWIIGTVIFGIFSLLLSLLKGFDALPYCGVIYVVLFIILKVAERAFNRGKLGEYLVSKSVKFIWMRYSNKIKSSLLDFEKPFESDILLACINNDIILSKHNKYCEIN